LKRREFLKIGAVASVFCFVPTYVDDVTTLLQRRGYTVESREKKIWTSYQTNRAPEKRVHYEYKVSHPQFKQDFFILEDRRDSNMSFHIESCYCETTTNYRGTFSNRVQAQEETLGAMVNRMDEFVWRSNHDSTWEFSPAWKHLQKRHLGI